ncbi:hypothetical protein J5N97_014647 [Dioscorea zingiberensis]|uniref:Bromo domain-containing protein n=1 Tax=Dioscorea zingiberensis TaxID=325984 RepID=A0A9D5HJZ2_9LILI|nr:hypothetical protein J5N97_014647 [Dioscorea zingiberensis]
MENRRGKKSAATTEKGKGKKARVVDLKETDTEEEFDEPVDVDSESEGEASAAPKGGKNKKIKQVKSTRKDEHELFSMPDNLETYDLGENLSVPRDFATLRQKHKDGMYQTLEQFKNDVYNLLKRALESNSPDSIPYQQLALAVKYLLDQADLIFRSLRTNPIYAEKELEAWHQKYFQYKKKAVRFEKSTSIFSVEILESRLRPRVASSMKQSSKDNEGAPSRRPQSLGTKKKTKKRSSSKPRGGRPSVNLDGAQDAGLSSSPTEQRRNTYKPEDNASHEIASMAFQPVELVYQSNSRSYEESMRNFVKDAGPVAKMVAEQKIQELAERNRAYQASNYQAFTNADMSSQIPPFSNWSDNIQFGANPTSISLTTASNLPASSASLPQSNRYAAIFESSTSLGHGTNFEDFNYVQGLSCELHTDELLDLFTKIGTPEFLQSSISNTETSSGGASESVLGVNSQLLYGQGSQAIYPGYASSVTAGSTTQKNMSSELKQPEFLQTSIFNMPPNSSQTLDDHFGIDTRLLSGKGMQPMDGYFGVTSQLHSGEGMQALYPSYASSVAPGLMMQINRSSELKQPEFFPGSVFNTAPSSREALLGGNSQLLTGKGKEVAYPSNANSIQLTYDLGENLSVPRDIATLKQKHKDGMYPTLEQFKNDVYNLLKKALESNRWDETEIGLLILLMQRSLRTNPIYVEKELEAWHQKYFQYKKKAVRFENSTTIFSVEILESRLRPKVASSMKQNSKDNDGAPSRRAQSLGTKNTKKRRSSKLHDGRPSVNLDGKEEISTSTTMKKQGLSPNHP